MVDQTASADTAFGVDIGGSGIKGAVVDTRTGELRTPRVRIATPKPSTPQNVAEVVVQLVQQGELDRPGRRHLPAVSSGGSLGGQLDPARSVPTPTPCSARRAASVG